MMAMLWIDRQKIHHVSHPPGLLTSKACGHQNSRSATWERSFLFRALDEFGCCCRHCTECGIQPCARSPPLSLQWQKMFESCKAKAYRLWESKNKSMNHEHHEHHRPWTILQRMPHTAPYASRLRLPIENPFTAPYSYTVLVCTPVFRQEGMRLVELPFQTSNQVH